MNCYPWRWQVLSFVQYLFLSISCIYFICYLFVAGHIMRTQDSHLSFNLGASKLETTIQALFILLCPVSVFTCPQVAPCWHLCSVFSYGVSSSASASVGLGTVLWLLHFGCCYFCGTGILNSLCNSGWPWTLDSPASASWVAEVTGLRYQAQLHSYLQMIWASSLPVFSLFSAVAELWSFPLQLAHPQWLANLSPHSHSSL